MGGMDCFPCRNDYGYDSSVSQREKYRKDITEVYTIKKGMRRWGGKSVCFLISRTIKKTKKDSERGDKDGQRRGKVSKRRMMMQGRTL